MKNDFLGLTLRKISVVQSRMIGAVFFSFVQRCLLLVCTAQSHAQVLPEFDTNMHLGVATCASSVCHGNISKVANENVWLNEFRIWTRDDYHSRAYQVLKTEESKNIAKKLGLASATGARVCLDCHADNIVRENRGPKFQINDGVGCEACHGGAQLWIDSHSVKGTSHAENIEKGMYPTENGVARAKLCLSCHYGTKDKLTTHRIMGAGHPRLSFELELFTADQPAHYEIDKDYLERKGDFSGFTIWVVGQLENAKASLALIEEYLFNNASLIPELYFYDCHACHHPMSNLRWQPTTAKTGMPPGAIRLNDANFLMLLELTQVLAPQKRTGLQRALIRLHKASMASKDSLKKALANLSNILNIIEPLLTKESYTEQQSKLVRARLLRQSAAGEYRDFAAAEQAFMAIQSISISLRQDAGLEKQLDLLFETVKEPDRFSPSRFISAAKKVRNAFN
ncbi:MAG: hypothetical protein JKY66_10665 [Spongiibacteraceae bacterium]|nr:hypothetical protein [Spongiibacteraceae bacterium]